MVYSEGEIVKKIDNFIKSPESEVVEFKEATVNFSFKEIGRYFSALSNEANIRGLQEGWLIFGITNNRIIKGTEYRKSGALQALKKEIASETNERLTFLEIYDVKYKECRLVVFQIPPALRGVPTLWNGAAWSRENESLAPLPMNKLDVIRAQVGVDWSKQIIKEASIDDLDSDAISYAKELFIRKKSNSKKTEELLSKLTNEELLNKAGLLIKGKVTNAALLLLGKAEDAYYFEGFIPRITWTLYNSDGSVKAYEHFDMPFLLAVDKVYQKIRNENYRYIAAQQTLFPEEVKQYDQDVVKELLNNCIAHSNYLLRGKINVEEFENRLVFINEGNFIPETVERTLEEGYKPPYYRNTFLCNAMVNLYMIDTIAMGIPKVFCLQREKYFPLPSYDLTDPNRVKVTLYGQIIDKNYTQLLYSKDNLDLRTVFLLDKVQKKELIGKDDALSLKKKGLIEGRYPNLFVSYKIASLVGTKTEYIKNQGFGDDIYASVIYKTLGTMGIARLAEIVTVVEDLLPKHMDKKQKLRKVANILQKLKHNGIVLQKGFGRAAKWEVVKK